MTMKAWRLARLGGALSFEGCAEAGRSRGWCSRPRRSLDDHVLNAAL